MKIRAELGWLLAIMHMVRLARSDRQSNVTAKNAAQPGTRPINGHANPEGQRR